jgi:hypothetical protein
MPESASAFGGIELTDSAHVKHRQALDTEKFNQRRLNSGNSYGRDRQMMDGLQ